MKIEFINLKEVDVNLQLEVRDWRNSEHVTKFFQIPYIELETHKKWLKSLYLENPRNIAFLIKVGSDYSGLVYFSNINLHEKTTDFGIYIYKTNLRGLGVGKFTLDWAIKYAKNEIGVDRIRLEVLSNNLNAKSLYEKSGFYYTGSKSSDIFCYELNLNRK